MKDVMLWSGLTSFLMSPYTMYGSQAGTARAHQKRTTVKAVLSENSLFCIEFRNVVNETFGIFPTKARICNRLTINVIAD